MRSFSRSIILACSLATCLTAQTTTFTSPAGFATKLGNQHVAAYALGFIGSAYSSVHQQITDPKMIQTKASLLRLEWRPSHVIYSSSSGQGRSFSRVSLRLGNAIKTLRKTFSTNWSSPPSLVFNASWSHPGYSTSRPKRVWGAAGTFVFSKPYLWDPSKGDLLQDWTHAGGRLLNGTPRALSHYVDGWRDPNETSYIHYTPARTTQTVAQYMPRHVGSPPYCGDSAIARGNAYALLAFSVYADKSLVRPGRAEIARAISGNTAPGKSVLAMLSLGGSDKGVQVGLVCNKLHVNPGFPLQIFASKAGNVSSGATAAFKFSTAPFLWDNTWAGRTVYWQAAWEDSVTRAPSLSLATKITLPKKPNYVPNQGIFTYSVGSPPVPKVFHSVGNHLPIARYTRR